MTTKWTQRYASRTENMHSSAIREILKFTQRPEIISFAGGLPAPELFPVREVLEATHRVMETNGGEALQYAVTEGYPPLRDLIVRHMSRYGIFCAPENVLITAGSQQALDLIGKVLINPGDRIVVEEPTYLGALQAWNTYEAEYLTVPTDDDGMQMDALEETLMNNEVKFIYALPNFQNPSGITMSAERRSQLVALADRFDVPIIEDDPYGQLRYEGEHETPLVVLDAHDNRPVECLENFIRGNVIYLSTFSKTLAPGFRVAWMVGPTEVISRMTFAKQGTDLHTGTLAQMIAYETARGGFLDRHIKVLRKVYRERRDLMLELMEECFPEGVTWTRPKGGLFLWVRLPEGMSSARLLERAITYQVAFVPGGPFYPHGGGENTFRMNFSNASPAQIEEGIKRLSIAIKEEIAEMQMA
jgi:2-aminoadipate transaminase